MTEYMEIQVRIRYLVRPGRDSSILHDNYSGVEPAPRKETAGPPIMMGTQAYGL